jgi:uncharacterized protein
MRRLDPRAPLVFDSRPLGRRPGSMRAISRSVPAPEGLEAGLVSVPVGTPVELDVRLEAVMEGVLVTGTARTTAAGQCGRCLDPVAVPVEVELCELYVYPDGDARSAGPDSEETDRLQGDHLDLEPHLRDAVVLALPLQPLCRDDCPGLCPGCGRRLDEVEPGHGHDVVDARWSALAGLELDPERTTETEES